MATRRAFLGGLIAAGATPRLGWAAVGAPAYLAAAREPDGAFRLYGLDQAGLETFSVPLPARGHAGAGHPTRAEAVAFARRPGTFALVLDCALGGVVARLTPPEGRVFNGHGAYDADGARLFTCEQDAKGSQGHIGVWETQSYTRIGSFPTHGIGPHEIRLMPDGRTLVIANGGIETRGRDKLNLDRMAPNLTFTDLAGRMLDQITLDPALSQNSIRHLAVREDGLVGFAMQWQGETSEVVPLLGLTRMNGGAPVLAEAPFGEQALLKGYAGSVAFTDTGEEIAITSPRGGRLHRFAPDGRFLGAMTRGDICGLAPMTGGYLASDGMGTLLAISDGLPKLLTRATRAWDNHIVAL